MQIFFKSLKIIVNVPSRILHLIIYVRIGIIIRLRAVSFSSSLVRVVHACARVERLPWLARFARQTKLRRDPAGSLDYHLKTHANPCVQLWAGDWLQEYRVTNGFGCRKSFTLKWKKKLSVDSIPSTYTLEIIMKFRFPLFVQDKDYITLNLFNK